MAVEAQCLLPVRSRGTADATEKKQRHGDLASTPHNAVGPPVTGAESGAAFFSNATASPMTMKRPRAEEEGQFVGASKRRVINVHPAVLHHVQRLNAEVHQWRLYAAAANAAAARQLRAKDEEIDAARWLNWQLQEQARAAHVDAQAWRDAAAASDAAAAALRADLGHVLGAQARARDEDDAESCCSCNNDNNGEGGGGGACVAGACRGCGGRDAAVVILPCRHLSACAPCAAAAMACPACGTPKAGSVAVNLV